MKFFRLWVQLTVDVFLSFVIVMGSLEGLQERQLVKQGEGWSILVIGRKNILIERTKRNIKIIDTCTGIWYKMDKNLK